MNEIKSTTNGLYWILLGFPKNITALLGSNSVNPTVVNSSLQSVYWVFLGFPGFSWMTCGPNEK